MFIPLSPEQVYTPYKAAWKPAKQRNRYEQGVCTSTLRHVHFCWVLLPKTPWVQLHRRPFARNPPRLDISPGPKGMAWTIGIERPQTRLLNPPKGRPVNGRPFQQETNRTSLRSLTRVRILHFSVARVQCLPFLSHGLSGSPHTSAFCRPWCSLLGAHRVDKPPSDAMVQTVPFGPIGSWFL